MLDATFQTGATLGVEGHSTSGEGDAAGADIDGAIEIEPGHRLPLVPRHLLKLFGGAQVTNRLTISADMQAVAGWCAGGNENNQHEADSAQLLGDGWPSRSLLTASVMV